MTIHPVLHVGRFARVSVQWSLGRWSAYHVVEAHDGRRVDFWFYKSGGALQKWELPSFD
jgi:hypothetical protein